MGALSDPDDRGWKASQYYDQNPSYKYVVVRKDFEHPEIVFKMASVMFDKMRTEGRYNEELAYYFQTNVDSTRRGRSPSILITAMRCIAAMRILTVH